MCEHEVDQPSQLDMELAEMIRAAKESAVPATMLDVVHTVVDWVGEGG